MWQAARLDLLPWAALLALIAALLPIIESARRGRFDLYSPLTFVTWSHLVPAHVLGGLALVNGWTPGLIVLIPSPDRALPLTMFYLAVGFLSVGLGYALPFGRSLGARLGRLLPDREWQPRSTIPGALVLLGIAGLLQYLAFRSGLMGYQVTDSLGSLDAALALSSQTISVAASALLWLAVFREPRLTRRTVPIVVLLVAWTIAISVVSGRRGALIQEILLAGGAYWLSGRRIGSRHAIVLGLAAALAVSVGMAYGTTFRLLKLTEERIAFSEYVDLSGRAVVATLDRGLAGNAEFVVRHLTERLELITTVAVIVANYERLQPFEHEFGLSDNIVSGVATSLIPRVIWPDKPSVLDPRAVGELYFGYRNSFGITPIGDLIRNFGPLSIPIGMALVGLGLRVLYAALIENRRVSMWRSAAYLVLLTSVSFEQFYGSILPTILRTGVVLAVALATVDVVTRLRGGSERWSA
jgi:hypothetical protein